MSKNKQWLYYGDGWGGDWIGKSVEISISDGKERWISISGCVSVFYRRSRTSGYDHGNVPGTEDAA